MLTKNGMKIGFMDDDCRVKGDFFNRSIIYESMIKLRFTELSTIKDFEAIDLSKVSDAQLYSEGWIHITPNKIYEQSFNLY